MCSDELIEFEKSDSPYNIYEFKEFIIKLTEKLQNEGRMVS
jgi:hypothetical protein